MVSPDSVVTMRAGREPSKIGNPTAGPNVNASRNFPGTCWHATRCPPSSTRYGLPAMTTRAPTAGLVRPRRWWPQSAHSCRPAIGSDQTNGPQRAPGAAPGRLRSRNHPIPRARAIVASPTSIWRPKTSALANCWCGRSRNCVLHVVWPMKVTPWATASVQKPSSWRPPPSGPCRSGMANAHAG